MTILRITHSLLGLVATFVLLGAYLSDLREVLDGTSSGGLALVIPFLAFAAVVVALTSSATALVLEMLALIVLGLAMAEGGMTSWNVAGGLGLIVMAALLFVQVRMGPDASD